MCQLGYLYDRTSVLECLKRLLVDEIPMPPVASHITSFKDVTTLKLTRAEGASKANGKPAGDVADGSEFLLMRSVRFACPLTGERRETLPFAVDRNSLHFARFPAEHLLRCLTFPALACLARHTPRLRQMREPTCDEPSRAFLQGWR